MIVVTFADERMRIAPWHRRPADYLPSGIDGKCLRAVIGRAAKRAQVSNGVLLRERRLRAETADGDDEDWRQLACLDPHLSAAS